MKCKYYKAKIRSSMEKDIYLKLSYLEIAPKIYNVHENSIIVQNIPCTLHDFLENKKIDKNILECVNRKIQDKIQLMHDNDIYHGDLHVDNILIGEDYEPYIIDFELSKCNAKKQNYVSDLMMKYEKKYMYRKVQSKIMTDYYLKEVNSETEKEIQIKMSNLGISPKILKIKDNDIYLKYIPYTLCEILTNENTDILEYKIKKKIKIMHENKICHTDLYDKHILVDDDHEVYIINFENSFYISENKNDDILERFIEYENQYKLK